MFLFTVGPALEPDRHRAEYAGIAFHAERWFVVDLENTPDTTLLAYIFKRGRLHDTSYRIGL